MNLAGSSLRRRLLFAMASLVLLGMAITAIYLREISDSNWFDLTDRTLQAQARSLVHSYDPQAANPLAALPEEWRAAYARPGSAFGYTIYDRFLRPVESSASLRGRILPLNGLPRGDQQMGELVLNGPDSVPTLAVALPGGGVAIVSRSGIKSEILAESLIREDLEPILIFMLFGVLAMIVITMVCFQSLRPIVAASRDAANIGPYGRHKRIDISKLPIEVLPLVDAFNGALNRLEEAHDFQRRLTADAAHELRTPLSVLSLRLQRARMGEGLDWPEIITDLARMARLIDQMLDLSRKEASAASSEGLAEVNLSRTIREAAAIVLPLTEERGRTIELEVPARFTLHAGRADDLADMVRNLIENAVIHGQGTVRVALSDAGNGQARLTVADEGPTPPEGELLFIRFRRGDEQRPGSGLGLAIVRQVASAHGGSVRFREGPTTCLEVLLPATIEDYRPAAS